jgi:hypothetical protein
MLEGHLLGLDTEPVLLAWRVASPMEQHSGEKTQALI